MAEKVSLHRSAAQGLVFTGAAQVVQLSLTLVLTVILARLLSPDDFGVIAMAAPVMAFLLLFQNLGLNQAAIQATEITPAQSSGLFWLNITASGLIALLMIGVSPLVALFYNDDRVGYLTAASAAMVMISGATLQHVALFDRALRFAALSRMEIIKNLTTFMVTIGLAIVLKSYWAIFVGALAGAFIHMVLIWKKSTWRPSAVPGMSGIESFVRFGGFMTGFNVLNFLSRNLDNVLIGKFSGPVALGLYDRSYKLMMFPLQNINAPLSRVMLPVLARVKSDPAEFRRIYITTIRTIALVSIPAIAVAGASSEHLVPLLLGDQWQDAAPIFAWLSMAALFQPLSNTTGWLFIVMERGKEFVAWGAFSAITTLIAFGLAAPHGPVVMAMAFFAASAFRLPILLVWSTRTGYISTLDLLMAIMPSLGASAFAWWLTHVLTGSAPFVVALPAALLASYLAAVGAQSLTAQGRQTMRLLLKLVGQLIGTVRARITSPRDQGDIAR